MVERESRICHCDLTDIGALQQAMGKILKSVSSVDILVNNAEMMRGIRSKG